MNERDDRKGFFLLMFAFCGEPTLIALVLFSAMVLREKSKNGRREPGIENH